MGTGRKILTRDYAEHTRKVVKPYLRTCQVRKVVGKAVGKNRPEFMRNLLKIKNLARTVPNLGYVRRGMLALGVICLIIGFISITIMTSKPAAAGATSQSVNIIRKTYAIDTISRSSNVVTVTLETAHDNLKPGQKIVIFGCTNPNFNTAADSQVTIASVTNTKTFTYNEAGVDETETASPGSVGGNYATLTAWEAGEQADLVTANTIAVAELYNDWQADGGLADTLTIDGFTTDSTHYVKIYTPSSERHQGTFGDGFKLVKTAQANNTYIVNIKDEYVRIEGLQIQLTNSGGYTGCRAINIDSQATGTSDIRIEKNIIKGVISGTGSEGIGIYGDDADAKVSIINNAIHGFANPATPNTAAIETRSGVYNLYNNTVHGNDIGIKIRGGAVTAKNNLANGNTIDYAGAFATTAANISEDNTSPDGAPYRRKSVTFVDEVNGDFHLDITDTVARDRGVNLSAIFIDDIDSSSRDADWDIGADESILRKGELLIKIGTDSGFEDGDIVHAFNYKRILNTHAQRICNVKNFGKNTDGLREPGTLLQDYLENTKEYKFERIGERTVKRTNLITGEEDIISDTPNAKGEYMDVPRYIERRLSHERHLIFGTKGSEYWYGGRTIITDAKIEKLWQEIEKKSNYRKKDHTKYPFTARELKKYCAISVDDFTDEEAAELTKGGVDSKGRKIKRKYKVDYKNLPGLTGRERVEILSIDKRATLRKKLFKRQEVVKAK